MLFCVGAVAMRGAGSTFNDLIDRKIDAQRRAHARAPVAFGPRQPGRGGGFHAGAGADRPRRAACPSIASPSGWGCVSLLLVAIYPFMKRFTSWPQAILGLAFSWGALMGWASISGDLGAPAVWFYASCFFWTIGYDTIYALQDRKDDVAAGVKSTALLFGDHVVFAVAVLYLATVVCAEIALDRRRRRLPGADRAGRLRLEAGLADPESSKARTKPWRLNCSAPTAPRASCSSPDCSRKTCCSTWCARTAYS